MRRRAERTTDDDGMVLPMVLVLTITISTVVVALAGYLTVELRYGRVVQDRANRLAAADGGLRFGIEKLRNFQTLCTTKAGNGGGFTVVFPPLINGADTTVTCQRVGNTTSDVQGFAAVVTGNGVPASQTMFDTQGAGGSSNIKTFSGPIYIADPTRISLQSKLEIDNGDLWYTKSDCSTPTSIPEIANGTMTFTPQFLRGPICTSLAWNSLFTAPSAVTPPVSPLNPAADTSNSSCTVFSPGKYTSITLGAAGNYFKAGNYYFENVALNIKNQSLIAGFPGGAGDSAKVDNSVCQTAMDADAAATLGAGGRGGVTIYMGGSSTINVDTGGQLEIYRRQQNESFVSLYALGSSGSGYIASSVNWSSWILSTKSGNNNDIAIHGLVWAPNAGVTLGNVTNAANGQLLGGLVVANLDTQASASATAFAIGIEPNPIDTRLLLTSTSTLHGQSTSIRAVVQFRPDTGELAVNSWRVVG